MQANDTSWHLRHTSAFFEEIEMTASPKLPLSSMAHCNPVPRIMAVTVGAKVLEYPSNWSPPFCPSLPALALSIRLVLGDSTPVSSWSQAKGRSLFVLLPNMIEFSHSWSIICRSPRYADTVWREIFLGRDLSVCGDYLCCAEK
jgi:hypothetical protein